MPSTGVWPNMPPCSRMMGWVPQVGMTDESPTTWEEETWALGFWSWFDLFCFDDYWNWVVYFGLTRKFFNASRLPQKNLHLSCNHQLKYFFARLFFLLFPFWVVGVLFFYHKSNSRQEKWMFLQSCFFLWQKRGELHNNKTWSEVVKSLRGNFLFCDVRLFPGIAPLRHGFMNVFRFSNYRKPNPNSTAGWVENVRHGTKAINIKTFETWNMFSGCAKDRPLCLPKFSKTL